MMRLKPGWPGPAVARSLWVVALAFLCAAGCQREGRDAEVEVVTSTTMLAAIVREIGGDRVEVAALVPDEVPPGEFEIVSGHLRQVTRADLVILSGWEAWAAEVSRAMEEPGDMALTGIPADLILPYYHLDAADSVTEALARRDPDGEMLYRYNRNDYRSRLAAEAEDLCAQMFGLGEVRVICSDAQAEFLDWLGFDIIGTYGGPEELSGEETARLIEVGQRNGVTLVVDDYHRGRNAGGEIAAGIGAARAVLSRYPDEDSYIDLLRRNAEELVSALGVRS